LSLVVLRLVGVNIVTTSAMRARKPTRSELCSTLVGIITAGSISKSLSRSWVMPMTTLSKTGLLACGRCFYVWQPLYDRVPKKCPRCKRKLADVGLLDPTLPGDILDLFGMDLTFYQRQQLFRAITLYISGNKAWAYVLLRWLHGEPDIEYYLP